MQALADANFNRVRAALITRRALAMVSAEYTFWLLAHCATLVCVAQCFALVVVGVLGWRFFNALERTDTPAPQIDNVEWPNNAGGA